ncbi:hypothetical protein IW140_006341 [Coemansia sp. RSA 1813]|nr:hypothetical protein EV178_006317 [Coemansia sp. RSA 1646]KAJ1765904.1 hypothetical protein LPJ74_006145 [Coemansia sp. RSA 1843]KAJ2085508.1 hypothetical protein IW138_006291 [Coemansia sp. RSA 986]KAJ2210381.1 hypothetical protein EV179_006278 [Coemansia sp. RSA 487]KAJ2562744.1 hypothetical protein IW140_006341 [Coemansia sp. RSA 1813]
MEDISNSAEHNPFVDESEEESNALTDVTAAFLHYKTYTLNSGIYRRLHSIDELSERHREIVASLGMIDKIKSAENLIRENYRFLLDLVHSSAAGAMPSPNESPDEFKAWFKQFFSARESAGNPPAADHHMEKLYSTLKQFVRDWSVEGQEERDLTYGPLLDALESEFSDVAPEARGKIHVLVPGAGLGRLSFEVCCRGFSSQGNEFSYFMLLASNFILNKSESTNQYTIYPFVHQFSNVVSAKDQLRPVSIPDVLPSSMSYSTTAEFSMTAGDFIEVYGSEREREKWDAVVTCFFMDTAKNVLDYLDTMWHAMKPGAVWINLGPLLWHFDNVAGEQSIELTRDEFVDLVSKVGFVLDSGLFKEKIPVSYTANSRSMLQYTYSTFMCVARKPYNNK